MIILFTLCGNFPAQRPILILPVSAILPDLIDSTPSFHLEVASCTPSTKPQAPKQQKTHPRVDFKMPFKRVRKLIKHYRNCMMWNYIKRPSDPASELPCVFKRCFVVGKGFQDDSWPDLWLFSRKPAKTQVYQGGNSSLNTTCLGGFLSKSTNFQDGIQAKPGTTAEKPIVFISILLIILFLLRVLAQEEDESNLWRSLCSIYVLAESATTCW